MENLKKGGKEKEKISGCRFIVVKMPAQSANRREIKAGRLASSVR